MHHCNIMYPSCDTIYTGVMLNVEITRTNLLLFLCSLVLSHRTNDTRYSVKLTNPVISSNTHPRISKSLPSSPFKEFCTITVERI